MEHKLSSGLWQQQNLSFVSRFLTELQNCLFSFKGASWLVSVRQKHKLVLWCGKSVRKGRNKKIFFIIPRKLSKNKVLMHWFGGGGHVM